MQSAVKSVRTRTTHFGHVVFQQRALLLKCSRLRANRIESKPMFTARRTGFAAVLSFILCSGSHAGNPTAFVDARILPIAGDLYEIVQGGVIPFPDDTTFMKRGGRIFPDGSLDMLRN